MATKKINPMADVQDPVATYTTEAAAEPAKKPATRKKAPKRAKEEELRVNLLTTKEKWENVKTLAHLRRINPNTLVENLIDKELAANEKLIQQFLSLSEEAQKEG